MMFLEALGHVLLQVIRRRRVVEGGEMHQVPQGANRLSATPGACYMRCHSSIHHLEAHGSVFVCQPLMFS